MTPLRSGCSSGVARGRGRNDKHGVRVGDVRACVVEIGGRRDAVGKRDGVEGRRGIS